MSTRPVSKRRAVTWRSVLSLAVLGGAAVLLTLTPGWSQQPVLTPDVDIDQKKLEEGGYTLRRVLESGAQFFSVPYLPYDRAADFGDGYGEGPDGPRRAQIDAFYPPDAAQYHFLRLNGLDSQSCYECHNSIGTYREPGTVGPGMQRKPGSAGGSAGSNSNAFINPDFPNPITFFIRNPPHVFGTGYTQTLASEMTEALSRLREAARVKAATQQGTPVTVQLVAKGLAFGQLTTTFFGAGSPATVVGCDDLCPDTNPDFGKQGFTDDVSGVTGVACDLVVRPFQWKGISSSVRHFARDATDFHFSLQATEKYGDLDCDKDGKRHEMTLGNISALVSFVTMTRPPGQVIPPGKERSVEAGRQIFLGQGPPPVKAKLSGQMCATCHAPSLTVERAELFVDNPGPATGVNCETLDAGLVSPVPSHDQLEAHRLIQGPIAALGDKLAADATLAVASVDQIAARLDQELDAYRAAQKPQGYTIPLTDLGPPGAVPPYVFPRLKPGRDGSVAVPLFSDLRTHDMGEALQDRGAQGADVPDICIPAPEFLTRPLWGVADTGPWLHDGRALTLRDAILLHEGQGSEANPIIEAFRSLAREEQDAVVDFLLSLRLPVEEGLRVTNR